MLSKFTALTQLNSWSAAPWPQPGKLDVVVKKNKRKRERKKKERGGDKQKLEKKENLLF